MRDFELRKFIIDYIKKNWDDNKTIDENIKQIFDYSDYCYSKLRDLFRELGNSHYIKFFIDCMESWDEYVYQISICEKWLTVVFRHDFDDIDNLQDLISYINTLNRESESTRRQIKRVIL